MSILEEMLANFAVSPSTEAILGIRKRVHDEKEILLLKMIKYLNDNHSRFHNLSYAEILAMFKQSQKDIKF